MERWKGKVRKDQRWSVTGSLERSGRKLEQTRSVSVKREEGKVARGRAGRRRGSGQEKCF